MEKTTRRSLLKVAAAGGVAAALGVGIKPETTGAQEREREQERENDQEHDEHRPISGPLANATINFGSWQTDPPFDRFAALSPPNPPNTPNNPNPINRNHHQLVPHEVTIQAGGTVNFIIGGFHHVLIYDDGTQPQNINANAQNPFFPLLIDDPNKRIYRGLNPQTVPQDRVETVNFPKRGTFLVICGVRPHFVNDGMFGFVKVLP